MGYFPRFRSRRSLTAATAEGLLAGRGVPGGAPAGQQALARLLEMAAAPGSEQELAGEVAAAAGFVQVTSQAASRGVIRRVLAAGACVIAVGGAAAYASVVSHPPHKMAHVPFGVPATPPAAPAPRVTGSPPPQWGRLRINPQGQSGYQMSHAATGPSVQLRPGGR